MKVLYSALRHDPRDPDLASGVDYNIHSAFLREGVKVRVVGPFLEPGWLLDRMLKRLYEVCLKRRYLKWNLQITRLSSSALNRVEREWKPDVVFGLFPPPLAFYKGSSPVVFNTDTTIAAWQDWNGEFGNWPARFMMWEEARAVRRSSRIITFSKWCGGEVMKRHGIAKDRIHVLPMPSALPRELLPDSNQFCPKRLESPLRLLLVGRDYKRKGIPIAIETTTRLNEKGIPTELIICGLTGEYQPPVRFAGLFRKSVRSELEQYAGLYRQAHLLIHPATFDPSPIVPAEAASFGVPTITNDVCGIPTSVSHGTSGLVLPKHSPPEAYVEAIVDLVKNPAKYTCLSEGAHRRYIEEQNWEVAGKRVMRVLEDVVNSGRN